MSANKFKRESKHRGTESRVLRRKAEKSIEGGRKCDMYTKVHLMTKPSRSGAAIEWPVGQKSEHIFGVLSLAVRHSALGSTHLAR
jgi:hypothetical protein